MKFEEKVSHILAESILKECRSWIGTPYIHQASLKGVGADCLGLVRGVWRHLYGSEPEKVPAYSPDWGEVNENETILNAAQRNFVKVDKEPLPADLLVFRWRQGVIAKHVGILSTENKFIHAYESSGVVEANLGVHWKNKIVAIYRFPNLPLKKEYK